MSLHHNHTAFSSISLVTILDTTGNNVSGAVIFKKLVYSTDKQVLIYTCTCIA